ncbi:MAG: matrixin family metalloprotease [Planctomycetota bacterium]
MFNTAFTWDVHNGSGPNIDFKRVATHELGHALGLDHDNTFPALMNTTYSQNIETPQTDDINGLRAIYGNISPEIMTTGDMDGNGQDDVITDFGKSGIWTWMNNSTAVKLHHLSPDTITCGDLDNNGEDDVIIDFGKHGIYIYMNNSPPWVKLLY